MRDIPFKDYPIDLSEVDTLLTEQNIPYVLRPHPAFAHEPQIKNLIGYSPAGEWQIVIPNEETIQYSIIRGLVSWGYYEIMNMENKGRFKDTKRYSDAKELVADLKEDMYGTNGS